MKERIVRFFTPRPLYTIEKAAALFAMTIMATAAFLSDDRWLRDVMFFVMDCMSLYLVMCLIVSCRITNHFMLKIKEQEIIMLTASESGCVASSQDDRTGMLQSMEAVKAASGRMLQLIEEWETYP